MAFFLWFSSVSRGYKMGTLVRNGLNYKLFMLIFTKFQKSFQGSTFSNCFRIFKWIQRESLFHRVPSVNWQAGIGFQINTLQTQGNEITLIQCCFNVTQVKQRGINVISTLCVCWVNLQKRTRKNIHNEVQLK